MNDPLDDRISRALHSEATGTPDAAAAHAEFLVRRRRHHQRLVTGAIVAAVVVVAAGVLALTNLHNGKQTLTAVARPSTSVAGDEPGAGVPGASAPASTTPGATTSPTTLTIGGTRATTTPGPTATTIPHTVASTAPAVGPGPPPPGTVVVNEADNGKSYTLVRGQHVEVRLSNDNVWTEPDTSNAAVATRTSGSTNSDGSAQAAFVAAGDGQAIVSADGRSHPLPCETATPRCMVPDHIVHFQVTVHVTG